MDHQWPTQNEHVWGPWLTQTGLPKATQYRTCIHPDCKKTETREAPKA